MTVPVEDFRGAGLDDEFAAVERAVERYRDGRISNVAVVAEPFAGRGALLDYAEELLEEETVERHRCSATADGEPDLGSADVFILDDCQYLFDRDVGGFDALDRFVESMARSESLFLTSWNRYAWSYLRAVRGVDRTFPEVVRVPDLDADGVANVVASIFGPDLPEYVERGSEGRIKSVEWTRRPVARWGDRSVDVPVLRVNPEYVLSWATSGTDKSTEAVVLEKIRRVADGNLGVAADLWARSVRDGEIATGDVDPLDPTFDLDDAGGLVLWTLVAKESMPREVLDGLREDVAVDPIVQHLDHQGVVHADDDAVTLTPQGLGPAVEELRRRRLLW